MNDDYSQVLRELTAALAYRLWQQRGCPHGTADLDWHEAEKIIGSRLSSLNSGLPSLAFSPEPNEGPSHLSAAYAQ